MEFLGNVCLFVSMISCAFALYDNMCTEETVFKPYIKIYENGRGGKLVVDDGPGFYDFSNEPNIYVCVNGPAWEYFEKKTRLGIVFDGSKFKVHHHECQFFNGLIGPGSADNQSYLTAILLMGLPDDYRKPFIQLFTAPLLQQNDEGGLEYQNVTSLMTIGRAPCTLIRGPDKTEITVYPMPTAENAYCQLPYEYLNNSLNAKSDPDIVEKVRNDLRNDVNLQSEGCEAIPKVGSFFAGLTSTLLTGFHTKNITDGEQKVATGNMTDLKALLDGNMTELANSTGGPPKENKDILTEIEAARKKISIANLKIANPNLNDSDKTQAISDRNVTQKELSDLFCDQQFSEKYFEAMKYVDADATKSLVGIAWTAVDTKLTAMETARKSVEDQIVKVEAAVTKLNGTDPTKSKDYEDAKKELKTERDAQADLEEKFKVEAMDAPALLAQARELTVHAKEVVMTAIETAKMLKDCKSKNNTATIKGSPLLSPSIVIPQKKETSLSASDHTANIEKEENCIPIQPLKNVCENAKPKRARACHLLQAVLGKPNLCSVEEVISATAPTQDPSPISVLNEGREAKADVIKLIQDIFGRACPKLGREFSERISNLVRCYLYKPLQDGGAGWGAPPPATNTSNAQVERVRKYWEYIKQALEDCTEKNYRLILNEEVAGSGNISLFKKDDNGEFKAYTILHSVEQADKEYAFNFALDMHYKMFSTVLGLCMPAYEKKIPLITDRFYSFYTDEVFEPLKMTWTDPADNIIYKFILGNYISGFGKFWASTCMEASFVFSGDTSYRPPRDLAVNSNSEKNFFIAGPLANSRGRY